MKLGTTELIKFKKLQRRLGLKKWQAVGVLESLWMFSSRESPQGDIGRFSNEDIAIAIEWEDSPDNLVETLTECGWLDTSIERRLVIHDWDEHMPNWLRGNLAKHKKPVFLGVSAKQPAR